MDKVSGIIKIDQRKRNPGRKIIFTTTEGEKFVFAVTLSEKEFQACKFQNVNCIAIVENNDG